MIILKQRIRYNIIVEVQINYLEVYNTIADLHKTLIN